MAIVNCPESMADATRPVGISHDGPRTAAMVSSSTHAHAKPLRRSQQTACKRQRWLDASWHDAHATTHVDQDADDPHGLSFRSRPVEGDDGRRATRREIRTGGRHGRAVGRAEAPGQAGVVRRVRHFGHKPVKRRPLGQVVVGTFDPGAASLP